MSSIYLLYGVTFFFILLLARFGFARHFTLAKNYNLVKGYSNRAAHKGQVYTGAGLVIAFIILLSAIVLNNIEFLFFEKLSAIIGASVLVSVIGLYDDFQDLTAFQKYVVLGFIIAMTVYSGNSPEGDYGIITNLNGFLGIYEIGYLIGFFFTGFVYLSIMNAINLIDGIDGYMSIFSIILFGMLFFINDLNGFYTHSIVSVIFIASMLVFLKHNFSRRMKLFVGDAGSLFLGFWIANFLILFITSAPVSNIVSIFSIKIENIPVLAIAALNIPVLDTLRVMLVRVLKKKSPFAADRNHLHHILIDKNISHFRTSLILCLINTLNLVLIFLLEPGFNSFELTAIYVGISCLWFGFFEYLKRN